MLRFDFDKFISAIQDVKQGVNERLRQWAEYEAQLEKLINWLGDSEVRSIFDLKIPSLNQPTKEIPIFPRNEISFLGCPEKLLSQILHGRKARTSGEIQGKSFLCFQIQMWLVPILGY